MRRAEQIRMGETGSAASVAMAGKSPTTRGGIPEGALQGLLVPRRGSCTANQRREGTHYRRAGHVQMSCGAAMCEAKVVNMSERGMAVEAPLAVRTGDWVEITFDDFEPIEGRVVWSKAGRMGLDFGESTIRLVPFS